ncbi:Na+_driven multidrug efflux pump [Hexamita inflata]|uniref:Na+_driven multidrug efflux pump n=1 Tax=Hexamita inflata TaxID=28002 RepID=A0ABP1J4J1_9EUKA
MNNDYLNSDVTVAREQLQSARSFDSENNDKIVNRLRDMKVSNLIWTFALPAIMANVVSAITNSVQANIQKEIMGNIGLSAYSIVQPLELMLTMYIAVGLSGGVVSFISPAFGSKDMRTAQKYLMHFMVLYFFVIVLVPLCTLPWLRQIVVLLGAPAGSEMAEYAYQYGLVIFSCGTVFYFINYGFGNILRATSRSMFNAVKQVITATIQLGLFYTFYYTIVRKTPSLYYCAIMAPAKNLACEQFNPFSQIMLVGVLIILSSLIIVQRFLLRWLHKLRELGDKLAFTMFKLGILYASTKETYSSRLLDIMIRSFQLCSLQSFNEVYKSLQILCKSRLILSVLNISILLQLSI